jgi:phosphoribosylanthranilate isomerase
MATNEGKCLVKICGVTQIADAHAIADLGAFAIGFNLVPASPRYVEPAQAKELVRSIAGRLVTVAVVADRSLAELQALQALLEVDYLQLHGDEPPELFESLGSKTFKAARIATAEDAAYAETFPGDWLLVDAKVQGALGGTGTAFDWQLVSGIARRRKLILAGGLRPENVGEAVRQIRPWAVDVASGVERPGSPRQKDLARVKAFISEAENASLS